MRRFVIKIGYFCFYALILLLFCEGCYFYSGWFVQKVNGWEVYAAIKQSKTRQKKKKLIVGDSVAMQLFPCDRDHDSVVSLACNQAVSMAGYYFLLTNYIETNKDDLPSEVIMLLNPLSLGNNLDGLSFHYFLKPYYNAEYFPLYSDQLRQRCQMIPFYWLANVPFVRSSSYSVTYELPKETYALVSPIAQEYLLKICMLLSDKNIAFTLRSVPVNEEKYDELQDKFEGCMEKQELPIELLTSLIEIQYYPKAMFIDEIHLTEQALSSIDKLQFIK